MERESVEIVSFATPLCKNGGGESILRDISSFLKSRRVSHHVVLATKANELEGELGLLNVPFTAINNKKIAITSSKIKYLTYFLSLCFSYKKIKHTIDFLNPKIIVVHGFPGSFLMGFYARMNANHSKMIYVHHFLKKRERGLVRRIYSYLLDSYDSIVAVSELTEKSLVACFPELSGKITSIPNAVKISDFKIATEKKELRSKFGLPADKIITLCVGRFTGFKNQEFLLSLYERIFKKGKKDWVLAFVGEGETLAGIKKKAVELGISENVYFLGQKTHEEVRQIFSCSDIFLYPSKLEGFGIVVVEALASGLPTVIFESIATPEFKSVTLVAKNEQDFEKITNDLLSNKEMVELYGKSGKKYIEETLSLEIVGEKWLNLFKNILK